MSDLAQAIIARLPTTDAAVYRGKVTAVDTLAGITTVTLAAGPVAAMQWLGTYVPVVGDMVAVVRSYTDWIVLGKLSTATVAAPVAATVTISPDSVQQADYALLTTNGAGSPAWGWSSGTAKQGRAESAWTTTYGDTGYWDGTKWVIVPGVTTNYTSREDFGALGLLSIPTLPAGATITSAKLRVSRNTSDGGGSIVSPVLYGHTLASTPSGSITPYLHASYGPWSPGTLAQGQTGTWDLPSGWIAAFMAGTLKGFGVWSTAVTAFASFNPATFCQLVITYTYTP